MKKINQITHNLTIIVLLVEIFIAVLISTTYNLSAIIPGSQYTLAFISHSFHLLIKNIFLQYNLNI